MMMSAIKNLSKKDGINASIIGMQMWLFETDCICLKRPPQKKTIVF